MKKFFGGLFMVIGFVIALASGLCSLYFFFNTIGDSGAMNGPGMIALFGGIPFVVGMALYKLGKTMRK